MRRQPQPRSARARDPPRDALQQDASLRIRAESSVRGVMCGKGFRSGDPRVRDEMFRFRPPRIKRPGTNCRQRSRGGACAVPGASPPLCRLLARTRCRPPPSPVRVAQVSHRSPRPPSAG
jgi:hypothetical protein